MPPTYLFVFLGVLLASIGVSCGLLSTLYKRLASYHPEKYRDMGEPSLFVNRTFRSDLSPMKFIFKREDRLLNDPLLSRLTAFMQVFFICYAALLVFGLVKIMALSPVFKGP